MPRHSADAWTGLAAFRVVTVAAQAATIYITWPLWQVRDHPPLLPALSLPEINTGPLLIFSLLFVVIKPRAGVFLHLLALVFAMLLDQTRMQPEVICLAVLMLGTLDSLEARSIARVYLISMWFFAGFHKVINPDYYMATVPRLLVPLLGTSPPWPLVCDILRSGLAIGEMSVSVFAIIPRTRRLAAVLAAVLHMSIFLYLSLRLNHNPAVWPWNLTLVLAGFVFIWPWKSSAKEDWRECSWAARAAVVLLFLSPFGYYFGVVDAYLAHCLYSNNTPRACIVHADGGESSMNALAINAPLPPAHRLFDAYFAKVAEPGDKLVVSDPRWWLVPERTKQAP